MFGKVYFIVTMTVDIFLPGSPARWMLHSSAVQLNVLKSLYQNLKPCNSQC